MGVLKQCDGSHEVVRAPFSGPPLPAALRGSEISELDELLDQLLLKAAPELVTVEGISTEYGCLTVDRRRRQSRAPQERSGFCSSVRGCSDPGYYFG
jgi:hypothetical protein